MPASASPITAPDAAPILGAAINPEATSIVGWPAQPGSDLLVDPEVVHGTDMGLIIAGAVMFGLGYIVPIVIDSTMQGDLPGWWLSAVPFGAFATSTMSGSQQYQQLSTVVGIPGAALQIAGLWLVLDALLGYTNEIRPSAPLGSQARVSFLPDAPGANVGGGSIVIDF